MPPKATDAPALEGQISIDDYLSHDFDALIAGEDEVSLGGDQDATWALRKLATLRKQLAANNAIAEEEANRIAAWLEAVNEPLRKQVTFVEGILNGYALHERTKNDRKTIVLPYGKLATRPVADKWEVADPDEFTKWALESHHTELIKTTIKPEALTVIKTALKVTEDGTVMSPEGEPVPGISFTKSTDVNVTITTL
jgi:Bacteriophage Mu Gam like protein